jgi:hypothetical protein
MISYAYYALLNSIIMALVMFYFEVPFYKIFKVIAVSFLLMILRMYIQFEGLDK